MLKKVRKFLRNPAVKPTKESMWWKHNLPTRGNEERTWLNITWFQTLTHSLICELFCLSNVSRSSSAMMVVLPVKTTTPMIRCYEHLFLQIEDVVWGFISFKMTMLGQLSWMVKFQWDRRAFRSFQLFHWQISFTLYKQVTPCIHSTCFL